MLFHEMECFGLMNFVNQILLFSLEPNQCSTTFKWRQFDDTHFILITWLASPSFHFPVHFSKVFVSLWDFMYHSRYRYKTHNCSISSREGFNIGDLVLGQGLKELEGGL